MLLRLGRPAFALVLLIAPAWAAAQPQALPGWWKGAVARFGGLGVLDIAPMPDADGGYGFVDGERVSVATRRAFRGGPQGTARSAQPRGRRGVSKPKASEASVRRKSY